MNARCGIGEVDACARTAPTAEGALMKLIFHIAPLHISGGVRSLVLKQLETAGLSARTVHNRLLRWITRLADH